MKRDIHQEVTNQIIEQMENAGEFQLPWAKAASMPTNADTGKMYNGINTLLLWIRANEESYTTPVWATFNQWKKLGCNLEGAKGKGQKILFYTIRTVKNKKTGEEEEIPFPRWSTVFNIEHAAGNEELISKLKGQALEAKVADLEAIDVFVANTGANIQIGGSSAFYAPKDDFIGMPEKAAFFDTKTSTATEAYYSTLLHELSHWTKHKTRLDRDLSKDCDPHHYAREELVAELSAAFLCTELGITQTPPADHAQYLKHWLNVMKGDSKAIFTAASHASKAVKYLKDLQPKASQKAA